MRNHNGGSLSMRSHDGGNLCCKELRRGTLGAIHRDQGDFQCKESRWEDSTNRDPSLSSDDHPPKMLDASHYRLVICDAAWYDFPSNRGIDTLYREWAKLLGATRHDATMSQTTYECFHCRCRRNGISRGGRGET